MGTDRRRKIRDASCVGVLDAHGGSPWSNGGNSLKVRLSPRRHARVPPWSGPGSQPPGPPTGRSRSAFCPLGHHRRTSAVNPWISRVSPVFSSRSWSTLAHSLCAIDPLTDAADGSDRSSPPRRQCKNRDDPTDDDHDVRGPRPVPAVVSVFSTPASRTSSRVATVCALAGAQASDVVSGAARPWEDPGVSLV